MMDNCDKIDVSLDELSKEILTTNRLLTMLMKYGLSRFKDHALEEISFCINSNLPTFNPVDPNSKVLSLGHEDKQGKTILDQYIGVRFPNSKNEVDMLINVEAQGNIYPKLRMRRRSKVYCSRMIHDQLPNIKKSRYEYILPTVSMWVCVNPPKKLRGKVIVQKLKMFEITNKKEYVIEDEDDTILVVCFYLGESENEAIQLLNLLYDRKHIENSRKILKEKYGIVLEKEMEKMCGLDEYRINQGIKIGKEEGITIGLSLGIEQTLLASIKNIMASLSVSLTEAMNILKIEEKDQAKYIKLINE